MRWMDGDGWMDGWRDELRWMDGGGLRRHMSHSIIVETSWSPDGRTPLHVRSVIDASRREKAWREGGAGVAAAEWRELVGAIP